MKLHERILSELGKSPDLDTMKKVWERYNCFFGHSGFIEFLRKNGFKVPNKFSKKII